jgi:anti-sigma B factor antagonist
MNREFLIDPRADATHILLTGEFDISALPAFYRAIHRALRAHPVRVVINLDGVTFLDSSGLGAIVAGYHTTTALGVGYRIGPAAPRPWPASWLSPGLIMRWRPSLPTTRTQVQPASRPPVRR